MSSRHSLEQILASAEKIHVTYDLKKKIIHTILISYLLFLSFSSTEKGLHHLFFWIQSIYHIISYISLNFSFALPVHFLHIYLFWPIFYSSQFHNVALLACWILVIYFQRTSFMVSQAYEPCPWFHHLTWWIYLSMSMKASLKMMLLNWLLIKLWVSLCTFQICGFIHLKGSLANKGSYIFWKEHVWGKHINEARWKCAQLI